VHVEGAAELICSELTFLTKSHASINPSRKYFAVWYLDVNGDPNPRKFGGRCAIGAG
jgi:hypothetical protein